MVNKNRDENDEKSMEIMIDIRKLCNMMKTTNRGEPGKYGNMM